MTRFLIWFEEVKKLYGFCPCCGELFRLSEADIYSKTPPPRTDFDELEFRRGQLENMIDRFEAKKEAIEAEATKKGQAKARRKLRKIAPYLYDRAVVAQDMKVIFDPVEYLVFHGLTEKKCTLLEFVDHPAETKEREKAQRSIQTAISGGNVEWQTFRVQSDGNIVKES
jgi:predicted Holliday junction resolvase-like endonuclease